MAALLCSRYAHSSLPQQQVAGRCMLRIPQRDCDKSESRVAEAAEGTAGCAMLSIFTCNCRLTMSLHCQSEVTASREVRGGWRGEFQELERIYLGDVGAE